MSRSEAGSRRREGKAAGSAWRREGELARVGTSSCHADFLTLSHLSEELVPHFPTSTLCLRQVFDRDKTLKRSLYLSNPLSCCCYLNDEGDILLGIGNRLVVVRASKYEFIGGQGTIQLMAVIVGRGMGHGGE